VQVGQSGREVPPPCRTGWIVFPFFTVIDDVEAPARTPATIRVPRRKVRDFFMLFLLKRVG
jgi:hypothetical protein